ncbi:MAG: nickel-dependent hydrogenase large subunit, partial [Candidatus Jacksonbacteria bacterium]
TRKDAAKYLQKFPSNSIYLNNLAQAIEIIHSIDHSLEILDSLMIKDEPSVPVNSKKSIGIGVIEAPRGLLFYKLDIDDSGQISDGQIIVPTSQNQINIELDIKKLVEDNIDLDRHELEHRIEILIRAYDPCMSCASHFLKVKWEE